ncbi:MAG TPA: DNA polymerase III subunit delta [Acetobacteraceae bacterium]|nr:DNA polymerase III subunit delta [Acetobacteraceae bacterium]
MKLEARRIASFLRDPGPARVVLLYGEDTGLIRERATALVRAVIGATDDPFRLATLARAVDLPTEAASGSLVGGRRVVRLSEAGEEAREPVAAVLSGQSDALVILEAPGLAPSRSRLVKLVEAHRDGVTIGCYAEEGEKLGETVRAWLAADGVAVEREALTWLVSQLGADHALNRREVEKLALYAGPGGRVDLALAEEAVGDVAGLSLDDALFAATAGDVATADRALGRALAEGAAPVSVIRAGIAHLVRLQRTALGVPAGPRVFFRREAAFHRALKLWSPEALAAALASFFRGEQEAKRTGAPAVALCRHLVLALARRATRSG